MAESGVYENKGIAGIYKDLDTAFKQNSYKNTIWKQDEYGEWINNHAD